MIKAWIPAFAGVTISTFVHAGTGGGLYYWFMKRQPPPIVAELDLSMSPLTNAVPNPGGGIGKKSEVWIAPKKNKKAPLPTPAAPEKIETKEEVVQEETNPCAGENCSETGAGSGGGGTGEGQGQYIPAEAAARKPRWIKNFITSRDYPLIARREGKDGRVVLVVLIDNEGRVRDARLMQGSYEALNEVALRKVREAVFTPAYDEKGRAVSCKVTLPIRFELK
ncbi:MAG: hypothetical protein KCHDKBKB_02549 [Elusimicrobia bacterium]|nr:hypothetical protein [Elusimicrobiota bacterium]